MKKLSYLIVLALILGLVLTGCSLLSNIGQAPATGQSGLSYLTKTVLLPDDLVGLWHFDGDVLDYSGNLNYGTLMGVTSWTSGKFGDALSFDGATTTLDYISVADSDLLDMTVSNELTIEAWVCTTDPSKNQQIVDKGEHANKTAYMLMIYGGNLYGRVNKDGDTACIYPYPVDGDWHHVAYTFKSGEQKLYLDGNPVATKTKSTTIKANDKPLFIGNGVERLNLYEWEGNIDEVRIWDKALDEYVIQQSYELGGVQTSPCVVQLSHQVLASGEVVCFTSAFYLDRQFPEVRKFVDIYIMSASGDRTIEGIGVRRVTPAKTTGDMISDGLVNDVTHYSAEVTNGPATPKGKTSTSIHLYVELDVGDPAERLGVNAQYLPWN